MNREIVVSVIIPTYNRCGLLERAIRTVLEQSLPANEIIVVDDGSKEGLLDDIKARFPQIIWLRQKNKGVAAARNYGIQESRSPWIALLDSDDEWDSRKLERQAEYILRNPQTRALHTDERWIRSGNEVMPPSYLDKSADHLWERSLRHCLVCPSSVMLHRSVFEEIGYFDESLTVCEDYDFWLRLLLRMPIDLVDQKLVIKHGGHSDQLSTITWGMDRFRILALQKLIKQNGLSNEQIVAIQNVLIEKCKIVEQGAHKRSKLEEAEKYSALVEEYSKLSCTHA